MRNKPAKPGRTNQYLEGQGHLASRLITPMTHRITPIIPIINLLLSPPDPPSRVTHRRGADVNKTPEPYLFPSHAWRGAFFPATREKPLCEARPKFQRPPAPFKIYNLRLLGVAPQQSSRHCPLRTCKELPPARISHTDRVWPTARFLRRRV